MSQRVQLSFGRIQVSRSSSLRFVALPRHVELEVVAFAATADGPRALADLLNTAPECCDRVVEKVLGALASGALEYLAWAPAAGLPPPSTDPTNLTALVDEDSPEVPIHAVILELVDTDNRPIPGAAYCLLDPEGRTHTGTLNHVGRAEIRTIRKPGNCKVAFPEFDNGAWSYVHAHPL